MAGGADEGLPLQILVFSRTLADEHHPGVRVTNTPEGIIDWIEEPSIELSNELMKSADVILATGGA